MTYGDTISIPPDDFSRNADGTLALDDYSQQVTAFHETSHVMQEMVYGARVNAFIDQGFHIHSSGNRNEAYRVTQQMFDDMDSIHDLSEHWEQQAELLEQSLRTLWARSQATGSNSPAVFEQYTPGMSLDVAGGHIELTPERWQKMLDFVHEWGTAARRALGSTGGRFTYSGTHDPI